MEELYFITTNRHKFEEAKDILAKHGINLKISEFEIPEKKYKTEKEVSISKAYEALKYVKAPLIVDDTGVYFEAYNNFPGPNAHIVFDGIGFAGILKLLEGKSRTVCIRTAITFIKLGMNPISFLGECNGRIVEKIPDEMDFAYDTIFIPDGDSRTFAQMTKEEKESYSHRRKALDEFAKWLKESKI